MLESFWLFSCDRGSSSLRSRKATSCVASLGARSQETCRAQPRDLKANPRNTPAVAPHSSFNSSRDHSQESFRKPSAVSTSQHRSISAAKSGTNRQKSQSSIIVFNGQCRNLNRDDVSAESNAPGSARSLQCSGASACRRL